MAVQAAGALHLRGGGWELGGETLGKSSELWLRGHGGGGAALLSSGHLVLAAGHGVKGSDGETRGGGIDLIAGDGHPEGGAGGSVSISGGRATDGTG
eukprot:CAMPEP_0172634250 /NCGR_PEP_ID=MMETSP1068-20121228/193579_1 /TAXON_ID=35684 /ORGANISM="Pseudopedinella elastica, Strain CCMP716" /LENGTH=96 /DNA_ID=CAMNT_0013446153 /DNA_START=6 /DNA_END=292 /DNA_ORIENTATION=-